MHIPAWNVIFPNGCVPLLFGSRTPDFGLSLFSCTFRLGTSWFFAFRNSGSGFPTVVDVRPMFSRALFSITPPVAPAFLKSGSYKTESGARNSVHCLPCRVPYRASRDFTSSLFSYTSPVAPAFLSGTMFGYLLSGAQDDRRFLLLARILNPSAPLAALASRAPGLAWLGSGFATRPQPRVPKTQ